MAFMVLFLILSEFKMNGNSQHHLNANYFIYNMLQSITKIAQPNISPKAHLNFSLFR